MTHIHQILEQFRLEGSSRGQLAHSSAQNMSNQIKGCLSTPHAYALDFMFFLKPFPTSKFITKEKTDTIPIIYKRKLRKFRRITVCLIRAVN